MRWYDLEPDVCMAISMIECAKGEKQIEFAEFIIKEIKTKDKEFCYLKNHTKNNLKGKYTRWYDKDDTLSTAFEYLKCTSQKLQKEVSLSVLAYMNTIAA